MNTIISSESDSINGSAIIPGDKSMSHRALILGALSIGKTYISGLLESDDVLSTLKALKDLGVKIHKNKLDIWEVVGVSLSGFKEPNNYLDLGNSGTGLRLLFGAILGSNIKVSFKGDESLSKRPMMRVIEPLTLMGCKISSKDNEMLPITIEGSNEVNSIKYSTHVASAQIKSAILLAGLSASGITEVVEPVASRNHTESMLRYFGADITSKIKKNGNNIIRLKGRPSLKGQDVSIPSDPSSASFPIVAALIIPGSKIKLDNIMINPGRDGLFETLKEMGGKITIKEKTLINNEIVASIEAEYSLLKGVIVPAERAAKMIDEFPILSIAASVSEGHTSMLGISELRVKETDRIKSVASGLKKCGLSIEENDESLKVYGGQIKGGCEIDSQLDHRIAMSFIILGLISEKPIIVKRCETIKTSFPHFIELMVSLGANIIEDTK